MSALTDAVIRGLELNTPQRAGGAAVDFVVTGPSGVLVGAAGWWDREWTAFDGLFSYTGGLRRDENVWLADPAGVSLTPAGDGDRQEEIDNNRLRADYDRLNYLNNLSMLREQSRGFDFDEWTRVFLARPVRDANVDRLAVENRHRQMGKVFLTDMTGNVVDVMILDQDGKSYVASGDTWLLSLAGDFTDRPKESIPDLYDYVTWVSSKQPYGPFALSGAEVFDSSGSLHDVANQMLSDKAIDVVSTPS